jgi:hypothetical protein
MADGAMIDCGVTIIPTETAPADDTAGTVQPNMAGVVLVVAPIVMLVVVPVVMLAVAPVVITAVAPVVTVVGPAVRPKGQDPVRLLVVVPAGKGDVAGIGAGEGSADPAVLVPI